MSALSDQLLKAGLVTKEQVDRAKEQPKSNKFNPKKSKANKPNNQKIKNKKTQEQSDLAHFYQERSRIEQKEKQDAIRIKKETARIKKETNQKINTLISTSLLNDESADIRYNFIVGTTIKYLFVTENQQNELINGKLAITFLGGKRSLIPVEVAKEILHLNPNKIVIIPVR